MQEPKSSLSKVSDEDETIVEGIFIASRVLVAVAARSLAGLGEEITLPQFRALVVLGSTGSQRPIDLAEGLAISPSTATRLCDRLVRKGLITRDRDAEDRREVKLELSRAGRKLVNTVTDRRRAEISRIVERIPARRRRALLTAFRLFAEAAGEMPDRAWRSTEDL